MPGGTSVRVKLRVTFLRGSPVTALTTPPSKLHISSAFVSATGAVDEAGDPDVGKVIVCAEMRAGKKTDRLAKRISTLLRKFAQTLSFSVVVVNESVRSQWAA